MRYQSSLATAYHMLSITVSENNAHSRRFKLTNLTTVVQAFIPERILRPFSAVPDIDKLAHDYFQLVINDVCVFEATVAQSQASYVAQQGIRKPTKEVLHHHGKALIHLGKKLADPVLSRQDATIHAILAIMGTHVGVRPRLACIQLTVAVLLR